MSGAVFLLTLIMPLDDSGAESRCLSSEGKWRPNVALLLERGDGKIFVAERVDRNEAWQFPQGGVDAGESLVDALQREVEEEIGLGPETYLIMEQREGYCYLFPDGHRKKDDFKGQEQTYFRCLFTEQDDAIDLNRAKPEFSRYQWIEPADFDIEWLPEFKREVYIRVLADFYGVNLRSC